ncbi:Ankyrin repeat-containing domain protein [Elaphomyces granulatus]
MTNKSDKQGQSLCWGAWKRVKATVQWAIAADRQQQHSPLPECYRHALNIAVGDRNVHLVKLLLEVNGMDITANIIDPSSGNSALHLACHRGETSVVKLLLAKDSIDINLRNENGNTPLMQAAKCPWVPVMKSLLARNDLDPNIRSFNGDHVVYPSLYLGYTIVKSLLDHPKADRDPNLVVGSFFRETGLMRACEIGDPNIVKLYLDREGIDLNRQDHGGCTALDKAIASYDNTQGRSEVIKLLLGQDNIDLNHRDNTTHGRTALHRACISSNLLAVDLLLKRKDIDPNARDNSGATPLTYACCSGPIRDPDIVKLYLDREGIDLNRRDHKGFTALDKAVASYSITQGRLEIIKLLLGRDNIDLNHRDNTTHGRTVLHRACIYGNLLVVDLLLKRKDVDPNARDNNGSTPLTYACCDRSSKNVDLVKLLLEVNGMDITANIIDPSSGNSALHLACDSGDTSIVKLLLAKDSIDINLCNKNGDSPLMQAAEWDPDIVKLYLDREGIDLNRQDHIGFTALDKAMASYYNTQGRSEIIKLLLSRDNIDLNHRDNTTHGRTALHKACIYNNLLAVDLLLKRKDIDPNARDNSGTTPLTYACCDPKTSIVKLLLAKDSIDINLCNKNGDTPLMQAAKCRSVPVMESLLARNDLDPNIRSFNGDHVVYPLLPLGYTIVKSLLDHPKADRDPNLVVGSFFRETGLMRACEIEDPDIVKLYLDREGIDLNRQDHGGCTALDKAIDSYCITQGRSEIIKLLLGRDNIDLNHRDNIHGRTVLHISGRSAAQEKGC